MTGEPTAEDAALHERTLRELVAATAGWTRFRVVRPYDEERLRREHDILIERGYTLWRNEGSTRIYRNPARSTMVDWEPELARTTIRMQRRPIRQFEDSPAGRARCEHMKLPLAGRSRPDEPCSTRTRRTRPFSNVADPGNEERSREEEEEERAFISFIRRLHVF